MEDMKPEKHKTYVDPRGPMSAAALIGLFVVATLCSKPARPESALPWTLNPTGEFTTVLGYVMMYAITIPAKEIMNVGLQFLGTSVFRFKRMDEGEGPVQKLEVLEFHDLCYLALNTLVEFLGLNYISAFLLSSHVVYPLRHFCLFSGPLAFVMIMVINDIIYYPFHAVAHRRSVYPLCHKQHHRQFLPFRGYADAANQHPFEQTYGFSIFILSMWITSKTLGLHASSAWFAMLSWAILNICNHLAFDTRIHLPVPYPALPRDHNMHHRFPTCNYSTLSTMMDRFYGTYRSYKPLGPQKVKLNPSAPVSVEELVAPVTRPEAVPSPKSFWVLLVALVVAATTIEAVRTGKCPDYHHYASFAKSTVCLNIAALACGALDPGAAGRQYFRKKVL